MRWPGDVRQLAPITRAARALDRSDWDDFFATVRAHLGRDGDHYREPTLADVEAAIEAGLAAVEAGRAPIPLRFCDVDERPRARDLKAVQLATAFAGQLTVRRRRA